jgi:hypothetical protein
MTEWIKAAAIQRNDNILAIGKSHAEIIKNSPFGTCKAGSVQGFVTNTNRFVRRDEASQIAFSAGQTEKQKKELMSEDIWGRYGRYDYNKETGYHLRDN